MGVTTTNLIQGPATLYAGIFGVAEPATIATVPGAGWLDVGGTQDGIEFTVADTYGQLTVDQLLMAPESRRTGRVVTLKTVLAEATLASLALVLNNTAPAANVFTPDEGITAFKPAYTALLLDGIAPGGFKRRFILRKTLATESVGTAYKKDAQTLLPVTWTAHYVSPSVPAYKIEDATS